MEGHTKGKMLGVVDPGSCSPTWNRFQVKKRARQKLFFKNGFAGVRAVDLRNGIAGVAA